MRWGTIRDVGGHGESRYVGRRRHARLRRHGGWMPVRDTAIVVVLGWAMIGLAWLRFQVVAPQVDLRPAFSMAMLAWSFAWPIHVWVRYRRAGRPAPQDQGVTEDPAAGRPWAEDPAAACATPQDRAAMVRRRISEQATRREAGLIRVRVLRQTAREQRSGPGEQSRPGGQG